jgi:hypothetical protein
MNPCKSLQINGTNGKTRTLVLRGVDQANKGPVSGVWVIITHDSSLESKYSDALPLKAFNMGYIVPSAYLVSVQARIQRQFVQLLPLLH